EASGQEIARVEGDRGGAGLHLEATARAELGAAGPPADAVPAAPRIDCRVVGGAPAFRVLAGRAADDPSLEPCIVAREGIDPAPVPLDDPLAVRWLRACLWPSDTARRARLDAAIAIAA